jgi:membrane-associated protease RseP (regulator of RpoE activity)
MIDALMYLAGVLVFTIGVAVSIGLHEVGHLVPGKLYDVKITQYFVGFGRTIWSRRRGETEYGVKAIPLGGYVKLVGMLPPAPDQDPEKVRSTPTGMFAQLVSDARSAEYEQVAPADHDRLFYRLPWWKRVVIMGSGVTINLVIAFGLFAVVFMGYGTAEASTTVGSVSQCVKVVQIGHDAGPCTAGDPVTPAVTAGLRPGDRVVELNGTRISSYDQLQRLIRANQSGAATLVVDRDGTTVTLRTNTTLNGLPSFEDPSKTVNAGFLGIRPALERQRQGVGYVASTMGEGTWETLKTIGAMPQKVYHVTRAALGLEEREVDSPMSVVGAGRVAGEFAADEQNSLADRFFSVVLLLAGLNLFLGLVNLVPLPPFDGAGIATTLYEAARRGIARLRGRPDPGTVDAAKLLPVTYVVASLLIVMTVILVYADIVAPVSLT